VFGCYRHSELIHGLSVGRRWTSLLHDSLLNLSTEVAISILCVHQSRRFKFCSRLAYDQNATACYLPHTYRSICVELQNVYGGDQFQRREHRYYKVGFT
jgi:hypothetical protein